MANPSVIHANAMVIHGYGVLITGDSGSGKTELCIALLQRGQRIIADDAVMLTQRGQQLIASAPPRTADRIAITPQHIQSITETFGQEALVTEYTLHIHAYLDHTHQQTSRCQLTQSLIQLPVDPDTAQDAAAFELLIQNRLNCLPDDLQEATC